MKSAGLSGRIEQLSAIQSRLVAPVLRRAGVSFSNFQLLALVAAEGATLNQADIGAELGVAPATLTEGIQDQVAKGWLRQVPDPNDRRAKRLELTAAGEQKLAEILPALRKLDALYDEPLGPAASKDLVKALDLVIRHLRTKLEES